MTIKPRQIARYRLEQIWAQVPPDYYDRGIAHNFLQRLWHRQKLAQVARLLPKNPQKVLDIGCSSAILTAQLAKHLPKSRFTGLDSYRKAIEYAHQKYPHIDFVVADAHKLPFATNSFDLIICTETLEHLLDPKGALLEMKRVLKKPGYAIISMDSGSPLFKIVWFAWTKTRGRVWANAHLHEFDTQILENLIRAAGFKIKEKVHSHLGMAVTFKVTPQK